MGGAYVVPSPPAQPGQNSPRIALTPDELLRRGFLRHIPGEHWDRVHVGVLSKDAYIFVDGNQILKVNVDDLLSEDTVCAVLLVL